MKNTLDIEAISAQWLSATLGYEVRSVTSEGKVGAGQTGAAYRLILDSDQGPPTLLAKVAAGDLAARQRVANGYWCEVGFYAEVVDSVDVRTPRCWHASISEDKLHFTLLLEDLAPRVPGAQEVGCSLAQTKEALRNLAGLHAPRWNDTELLAFKFIPNTLTEKRAAFLGNIAQPAGAEFVKRYRDLLGSVDAETMRVATESIARWCLASLEPFSILHGDYRLDNLMFGVEPDDVVALDWQTAAIGPPTRDVAYFLATSLDVDTRRHRERELVAVYHQALLARGIKGYDIDQCFNDYRLGQLQAPMIVAIGCIYATGERSESSDAMFLSLARRSCAAIRDLGTLDLLK